MLKAFDHHYYSVRYFSTRGEKINNHDNILIDSYFIEDLVIALADGVGSNPCGKEAAYYTCEQFRRKIFKAPVSLSKVDLNKIIAEINEEIFSTYDKNNKCNGLATTFCGCIIHSNMLNCTIIGDVSVRLCRDGRYTELNNTIANRENNDELQAIGTKPLINPYSFCLKLKPNDFLFLSTDGFYSSDCFIEILNILIKYGQLFNNLNQFWKRLSTDHKFIDNASFICIRI